VKIQPGALEDDEEPFQGVILRVLQVEPMMNPRIQQMLRSKWNGILLLKKKRKKNQLTQIAACMALFLLATSACH
jgi:hypothetical protein